MREDTKNQASEEYNVTKLSMQFRVQELEKALLQHHQAYLATDGKRSQVWPCRRAPSRFSQGLGFRV